MLRWLYWRLIDRYDEWRLAHCREFIDAMSKIAAAIETTTIDWDRIKKVDSLSDI